MLCSMSFTTGNKMKNLYKIIAIVATLLFGQVGFVSAQTKPGEGGGLGTVTSVGAGCSLTPTITTAGTLDVQHLVDARTTTSEAILDGDCGDLITFNNASAIAATIAEAGAAGDFAAGWFVILRNLGAGVVTLTPTTSTVDGNATLVIRTDQSVFLFSDGTNYQIIGLAMPLDYVGANSLANAKRTGDGTTQKCEYTDGTTGIEERPCTASDTHKTVLTNFKFCFKDEESANAKMLCFDPDNVSLMKIWDFPTATYRLKKPFYWTAGSTSPDGTECSAPAEESIGSGADVVKPVTVACPMGTSETDGTILLDPIQIPGYFDKTSDLVLTITAKLTTDSGAGTLHGVFAGKCVGPGESHGKAFGTGVNADLTPVAGDVVDDDIQDISAALDTDTTGIDCDGGDIFYGKITVCDTDASPSTGCTSSAGFENDMSFVSFYGNYRVNSLSSDD